MQLTQKGVPAVVPPSVTTMLATLSWTGAVDFDLMLIAREKGTGDLKPFYFGNKSGPGVQMGGDAGVGDTAGANSEEATITDFAQHYDSGVLCILDYNMACSGQTGRFDTDTPKVQLMGFGNDGSQLVDHSAEPDGGMLDGNVCAIGKLTTQGPVVKFELLGESSVLKGFDGESLTAFAQSCGV
jgi:hypothetical protein